MAVQLRVAAEPAKAIRAAALLNICSSSSSSSNGKSLGLCWFLLSVRLLVMLNKPVFIAGPASMWLSSLQVGVVGLDPVMFSAVTFCPIRLLDSCVWVCVVLACSSCSSSDGDCGNVSSQCARTGNRPMPHHCFFCDVLGCGCYSCVVFCCFANGWALMVMVTMAGWSKGTSPLLWSPAFFVIFYITKNYTITRRTFDRPTSVRVNIDGFI